MLIEQIDHFAYSVHWNPAGGWCILRVYSNGGNLIVVAEEPIDRTTGENLNQGVSVTNAIEMIQTRVRTELGFGWTNFVEHYPTRGRNVSQGWGDLLFAESFTIVNCEWDARAYAFFTPDRPNGYRKPCWHHITRAEVERLIGQPYP